jgi:hypothetical protein
VVDADVAAVVAVFRHDTTKSGVPPIVLKEPAAVLPAASVPNAQAGLSRLAQTTPDGDDVYLVPLSDGGVCLVTSSTSEDGCAPKEAVLSGEATSSDTCSPSVPPSQIEIAGIVPDGISDAQVTLSDGSHVPLDVVNNTYVARFARDGALPASIGWDTDEGGHRDIDALIPKDTAAMDCEPAGVAPDLRKWKVGPLPKPTEPTGHVVYNNG